LIGKEHYISTEGAREHPDSKSLSGFQSEWVIRQIAGPSGQSGGAEPRAGTARCQESVTDYEPDKHSQAADDPTRSNI
jgi:hypothetical protein